jgi:uncharacterized protein YdeI (YjbR/CyaY-like superfamily)
MTGNEPTMRGFKTAAEFRSWLADNYTDQTGIWLRFYKKASGTPSINYSEALDEALCYGWIDGQVKKYDESSYLQRFTPRRQRSIWSKRNTKHAERLIAAGRMQPAGLAEVETAKEDGRWDKAYDSPGNITMPEDFLQELSKNPKAEAFFKSLNKTNAYAIAWRLQTAKRPETREKWKQTILSMMAEGKKFH